MGNLLSRKLDAKSFLAVLGILAALALLVVGVLYAPAWIQETWTKATYKPLVTREMYRKIKPGMTVAQVQAIVGAKGDQSGMGSNLSALKLTVGMSMAQIQAVRNSPEAQTQNQPWELYEWKNPPPWVTYLKVLFVNGHATEITEHGLQ
jgi:hypothetical protein